MKTKFTYWKESDGRYVGYLNSHPDHWTQGDNLWHLLTWLITNRSSDWSVSCRTVVLETGHQSLAAERSHLGVGRGIRP